MATWVQRLAERVYREYDRRIKRASVIAEYGPTHPTDDNEDDDGVEIVNVPRGTIVAPREHSEP